MRGSRLRWSTPLKIVMIAMAVLSIFFSTVLVISYSQAVKSQNTLLSSVAAETQTNVTRMLQNLENTTYFFLSSDIISAWKNNQLTLSSLSAEDIGLLRSDIQRKISYDVSWDGEYISSAYLYADDTSIELFFRTHATLEQEKAEFKKCRVQMQNSDEFTRFFLSPDGKRIYFCKKIRDVTFSREMILLLALSSENMSKALAVSIPDADVYLVDQSGTIFLDPSLQSLGVPYSETSGQVPMLENRRPIGAYPFSLYVVYPKFLILKTALQELAPSLVSITVIFFVCIFSLLAVVKKYNHALTEVVRGMEQVKSNNYNIQLPRYKDPELDLFGQTFNEMVDQVKHLLETVYEKELLLKEADIALLQSQTNPHFLINTLTTISTTALLNGDTKTYEMITALACLLTAGLNNTEKSQQFIAVLTELEYIQLYLQIQKVRFGERLEYNISVSDEALHNLFVPRLSLVPFVENAVKHGMENKLDPTHIRVSLTQQEDSLVCVISDDGCGFNPEEISSLGSSHIGLANTQKRIHLLCGAEYGFTVQSQKGSGTTITVTLPLLRDLPKN